MPFILLLVGFGLTYLTYIEQLPAGLVGLAETYIQFFFVPYGLMTFFIGGFLAPRASYLIGFLLGVVDGGLWAILIFIGTTLPAPSGEAAVATTAVDAATQVMLIAVLYGTLAAAFAAWYRSFLRDMQERGRQRRAEREAQERAKRRDERRAAKRPTS